MSEEGVIEKRLEKVFAKYADITLEQNKGLNESLTRRVEDLATHTAKMADNLSELMVVISKAEERHTTHSNQINRLELNQREVGKDLKDYKDKNDNRVVDIEKQILLLDKDVGANAKPWNNVKAIIMAVSGTVLAAVVITMVIPS